MKTIKASEVKQRLGKYLDEAMREPVLIEKSGRPVIVMLSVESYEQLMKLEDYVLSEKIKQSEASGYLGTTATQEFLLGMEKSVKA